MPRTDIGGGARILFELSDRLLRRGHDVTVLSFAGPPTWYELQAPFTRVPVGTPLALAVPACDVVLAGYWELVPEVAALQVAPVVHLEQGDYHLFEDLPEAVESTVARCLHAADAHTVVSSTVEKILLDRYGVMADVVPNAVDPAVFHPGRRPAGLTGRRTVMAVGWDGNDFKGIAHVRSVANKLRTSHPEVDVVWVTPKAPASSPGDIARVVVAPTQDQLADLYGKASVYLCASHYESFPLPPMEAMACGVPVVSTRNPGALEYCTDGGNSLLVPVGDADAMHQAVTSVLDDEALAERLRAAGRETVAQYTWEAVVDKAEATYRRVAEAHASTTAQTSWTVDPDLRPLSPPDDLPSGTLEGVMSRTGAQRVLVPVAHEIPSGRTVHRWEVLATRGGGTGDVHVGTLHERRGAPLESVFSRVDAAWHARGPGEALDVAAAALSGTTTREERAALVARAAECLIALGRELQALELVVSAWSDHPDYGDLFHLAGRAAAQYGLSVSHEELGEILSVTGPGYRYAEWQAPIRTT